MNLIYKFGGRKFFYGTIFEVMILIMRILDYIDGEQFVYSTLIIYGTMAGTNAITTMIGLKNGNKTETPERVG